MNRMIAAETDLQGAEPIEGDVSRKLRIVAGAKTEDETFVSVGGDDPLRDLARLADSSASLLYCGDVIHRLPRADAGRLIAASFRVLKPLGRFRVATLDLDAIIHGYLFDWTHEADADGSRTQRLNAALRAPAVKFLYGEEELTALLSRAGFVEITRFGSGASSDPRFWNLESDRAQALALEARKP